MTNAHSDDLELLRTAAADAAAVAMRYFRNGPKAWTKGEGSPVSEADIAVDGRLFATLRAARPDYGWLSEETADGPERLECARAFVVDPIDGTRAFLAGSEEWTISLAVVERGRPVAGVLIGPAMGRSYWAAGGGGAFRDGARLDAAGGEPDGNAVLAGAKRYARAFEAGTGIPTQARFVASLAYRIALVASGEADAAIARPDARDWDLAAADLLVQEAGARLTDLSGGTLRYNGKETVHPTLIATRPELFGRVADAVRSASLPTEPGRDDGGNRSGQREQAAASSPGVRGGA